VPTYEFTGGDPVDHFWAGRVSPGDVVEFADTPDGPWKPSKKKATVERPGDPRGQDTPTSEPDSETDETEEG
jgi:hypothetical protein